eukprot:3902848-Rhodomonas_salina.1
MRRRVWGRKAQGRGRGRGRGGAHGRKSGYCSMLDTTWNTCSGATMCCVSTGHRVALAEKEAETTWTVAHQSPLPVLVRFGRPAMGRGGETGRDEERERRECCVSTGRSAVDRFCVCVRELRFGQKQRVRSWASITRTP